MSLTQVATWTLQLLTTCVGAFAALNKRDLFGTTSHWD